MYNTVTLTGLIGSDPMLRTSKNGKPFVTFRLGCTPRIKRDGQWVDDGTIWFSVYAWGHLAQNTYDSVRKGDRLVVHGTMRIQQWVSAEGEARETKVVDAQTLGPDLTFAVARPQRRQEIVGPECEVAVDPFTGEIVESMDDCESAEPDGAVAVEDEADLVRAQTR